MDDAVAKREIIELKKKILKIALKTGEGHLPSAFSILDILYVLYFDVMKVDPQNPDWNERDLLVVSKGHAAIAIYSVLASKGFFSWNELEKLGDYGNAFGGHPDYNKIPGIEASTGSLSGTKAHRARRYPYSNACFRKGSRRGRCTSPARK